MTATFDGKFCQHFMNQDAIVHVVVRKMPMHNDRTHGLADSKDETSNMLKASSMTICSLTSGLWAMTFGADSSQALRSLYCVYRIYHVRVRTARVFGFDAATVGV